MRKLSSLALIGLLLCGADAAASDLERSVRAQFAEVRGLALLEECVYPAPPAAPTRARFRYAPEPTGPHSARSREVQCSDSGGGMTCELVRESVRFDADSRDYFVLDPALPLERGLAIAKAYRSERVAPRFQASLRSYRLREIRASGDEIELWISSCGCQESLGARLGSAALGPYLEVVREPSFSCLADESLRGEITVAASSRTLYKRTDFAALPLRSPLLSQLGPGETAILQRTQGGCFGGTTKELLFYGPPPLRVVARYDEDGYTHGTDLVPVGETHLSAEDALRVDRILAYYRKPTGTPSCQPGPFVDPELVAVTSYDEISVVWSVGGRAVTESWLGGGCFVDDAVTLPLDSVYERARQAGLPSRR